MATQGIRWELAATVTKARNLKWSLEATSHLPVKASWVQNPEHLAPWCPRPSGCLITAAQACVACNPVTFRISGQSTPRPCYITLTSFPACIMVRCDYTMSSPHSRLLPLNLATLKITSVFVISHRKWHTEDIQMQSCWMNDHIIHSQQIDLVNCL